MRKRGFVLLGIFVLVLLSSFAFAQLSEYGDEFALATQCLDEKIRTTQTFTLEEAVYSVLAGSEDNSVLSTIDNAKHSSEECWPSGGCTIKKTAQVAWAKQAMGENVDDVLSWLKEHTTTPSDLLWYLQITIDNNRQAECNIEYDGSDHRLIVNKDLTLTPGSPGLGSCLKIDFNNFWLRISPNCVDKEFRIGCNWESENSANERFLSNLVYKENVDGTTFVSSGTASSPEGGSQSQKISAKCFTTGGGCDYEGGLWATGALHKAGEETTNFVPYLLGLANSNLQYFPSSFLMWILGQGSNGDQYASVNSAARGGHWDITGGYSPFVDTGLAMIAFGGGDSSEITNFDTLGWLFSQATEEGCFSNNDISDTAFIIYAAKWRGGDGVSTGGTIPGGGLPGADEICEDAGGTCKGNCSLEETGTEAVCADETQTCCVSEFTGGGGEPAPLIDDCVYANYYCGDKVGCIIGGGTIVNEYECVLPSQFCCTVPIQLNTCGSLGGEICTSSEVCTDSTVQSEDGPCCVSGTCNPIGGGEIPDTPANTLPDETGEGTSVWVWIIILFVLIGMAVLGIIFRDKLRMWIFKRRGKVKTSEVRPGGFSGPITGRRPPPRFGPPPSAVRGFGAPVRKPVGRQDKEMEDTLKKLKEMSE